MKKIFNLIVIWITIFLLAFIVSAPVKAFRGNDDGYFQKIDCKSVLGTPVKLKDGRILISDLKQLYNPQNYIFDPNTNSLSKTTPFGDDITPSEGVLLNNGKVFFIGPMTEPPSSKFMREIGNEMEQYPPYEGFDYREFRHLSDEKVKQKIYLPVIERNPELMAKYQEYLSNCDKSMHARLYNPETEEFEYSGRLNTILWGIKVTLLKDGRVLVIGTGMSDIGYAKVAEIYNPVTEKFTLLGKISPISDSVTMKLITLDDGRVFIEISTKYIIYDPVKNTFSNPKFLTYNFTDFLKLNDGRILFFTGMISEYNAYAVLNPPESITHGTNMNVGIYEWKRHNAMTIKVYDPVKDEVYTVGNLAIPRGEANDYVATLLKDGRVLITGGQKNIENFRLGDSSIRLKEAEIFDPNTGQSKLIKKMHQEIGSNSSILLNDGRVLFQRIPTYELYIPKDLKK